MRFSIVFILLIVSNLSLAQNVGHSWSFGANPYYGGVLKYKKNMKQLEYSNLHGIEFYANKIADGSKTWHHLYGFPQWGIAASYVNYGVPDELGWVTSLTTYLDMTSSKKKHKWRLNIGTGIVYSSERFDAVENQENKAISSKISYVMRGTIHKEFQLNEKWFFNANLAFRHYSNGKLNMPNNGMNYPMIGFGVRYVPHPKPMPEKQDIQIDYSRKIRIAARGAISWREVWQEDVKHKAYSFAVYAGKQVSKYNRILVGLDATKYDQKSVDNANVVYRDKSNLGEDEVLDNGNTQAAVTIGTELLISKVSLLVQGAIYVYKPQAFYSGWYQRYGLLYNFNEHLFSQMTLKAHGRTADMIEFGVGVAF